MRMYRNKLVLLYLLLVRLYLRNALKLKILLFRRMLHVIILIVLCLRGRLLCYDLVRLLMTRRCLLVLLNGLILCNVIVCLRWLVLRRWT